MDFIDDDRNLLFHHYFSPQLGQASCFPGDVDLDQEPFVDNTLDMSQPGFNCRHVDSLPYNQWRLDSHSTYASLASIRGVPVVKANDTFDGACELELAAVSFDSDPLSLPGLDDSDMHDLQPNLVQHRAVEPSMRDAVGNMHLSGMSIGDNFQPRLSHSTRESASSSMNICHEPGCNSRTFSTTTAFRKHREKHTRPYACTQLSCNHRRFGTKAGLTRHRREVHSDKIHYCPFRSCARHTNGFARKYNLFKHQETCHDDLPLGRARANRRNVHKELIVLDELLSKEEDDDDNDNRTVTDPEKGSYSSHNDEAENQQWRRGRRKGEVSEFSSLPLPSIEDPSSEHDDEYSRPRVQDDKEDDRRPFSESSLKGKLGWKLRDLKSKREMINREIARLERMAVREQEW